MSVAISRMHLSDLLGGFSGAPSVGAPRVGACCGECAMTGKTGCATCKKGRYSVGAVEDSTLDTALAATQQMFNDIVDANAPGFLSNGGEYSDLIGQASAAQGCFLNLRATSSDGRDEAVYNNCVRLYQNTRAAFVGRGGSTSSPESLLMLAEHPQPSPTPIVLEPVNIEGQLPGPSPAPLPAPTPQAPPPVHKAGLGGGGAFWLGVAAVGAYFLFKMR